MEESASEVFAAAFAVHPSDAAAQAAAVAKGVYFYSAAGPWAAARLLLAHVVQRMGKLPSGFQAGAASSGSVLQACAMV